MPLIVNGRIAKACELLATAVHGNGHADVVVVLIVCDYIYGIVAIFDNVMALVRVDTCASKDLVPDGLVRHTDSECPEAIYMKVEGCCEQRGISAEILFAIFEPAFPGFSCLGCGAHSISILIGI